MGKEDLEVYPKSLRKSGGGLEDVADQVDNAWQGLVNSVSGMGEAFGDDMVSSLIATMYQSVQEAADETYTSVVDGMRDFGDGLMLMADNAEGAESDSADAVKAVDQIEV